MRLWIYLRGVAAALRRT